MTASAAVPAARWGFAPWVAAAGGAAVAGGLLWALVTSESRDRLVAIVLTIAGLVVLVAGRRLRQRLIADTTGITVRSLIGSRSVPWSDIAKIGTVAHRRLGTRSSLLEIDLADGSLLAFSSTELGSSGDDVARALKALRPH